MTPSALGMSASADQRPAATRSSPSAASYFFCWRYASARSKYTGSNAGTASSTCVQAAMAGA